MLDLGAGLRGSTLAHALANDWPHYVTYVVSFVTIGIIWLNHNAMFRRVASVDHALMSLNLLLLLTIGALPFSTALMAHYLTASGGAKLAAAVYSGSFLVMSLAFFAMQGYLLGPEGKLVHERVTPTIRRAILRRNATGLLPYAVATAAAALTPYLTIGICAVVAGYYAVPVTTADEE